MYYNILYCPRFLRTIFFNILFFKFTMIFFFFNVSYLLLSPFSEIFISSVIFSSYRLNFFKFMVSFTLLVLLLCSLIIIIFYFMSLTMHLVTAHYSLLITVLNYHMVLVYWLVFLLTVDHICLFFLCPVFFCFELDIMDAI